MVKQAGDETFNKNRLLNAGYNFARAHVTDIDFDCIIFHDTDLLLENGTNLYTCDSQHVRHLCPEVDTVSFFMKNENYRILWKKDCGRIGQLSLFRPKFVQNYR